jgi:hypothetical protein
MIVRDLQFFALDGTTNNYKSITPEYTFIIPPLWPWSVRITERVCVVLEPTEGSLDNPTPNAFVSAIPPSWTAGNDFTLTLIQQDWEVEGFAINDQVYLLLTQNLFSTPPIYIVVHATIRSINANVATFRIINAVVSGAVNLQNPVAATCFLLDETNNVEGAFHTGNNSGDTSPLSGLPFMQPHADGLVVSTFNSSFLPPLTYNTRLYSAGENLMDGVFPALQSRRYREYTHILSGTQFYAYRTNLDPTAQVPTNLYPLNGNIDINIKKRSVVRSFDLTFNCLLLHPNRAENTNVFLPPGTLTISGTSGTLTPPSGFTPQRSRICLLGSDTHHSSEIIQNSIELTDPQTPPNLPPARQGASYVGVMVGQTSSGRWIAVMTNKEESVQPILGVFSVNNPLRKLYRYDTLGGVLQDYTEFPGIYAIQTLLEVNNLFVPIDEVTYNTSDVVATPFVGNPYFASLSNLYPYFQGGNSVTNSPALFAALNWDLSIPNTPSDTPLLTPPKFLVFMIPVPSLRRVPTITASVTAPAGGYGLDLINWQGQPINLKWRLFLPSGAVFESNIITFGDTSSSLLTQFAPDNQFATITETTSFITVFKPTGGFSNKQICITTIRAAVFERPEGYKPVIQSIKTIGEIYSTSTIGFDREEINPNLQIFRPPFFLGAYFIVLNKASLPPGRYTLHVRHSVRDVDVSPSFQEASIVEESYFYDFVVPATPINQPASPLTKKTCDPVTPALNNEPWEFMYIDNTGNWQYVSTNVTECKLQNYCTCFTIANVIPKDYIDIIAYFKGTVYGLDIPNNAKHKARLIGKITRIDDEYQTEDFVTSTYKKESIVRAYSEKYEVELLITNSCDMSHVDLIKFAEKCDIINRSNYILPDIIYDLKPENISITNELLFARVKIAFSRTRWRDEYRRQG